LTDRERAKERMITLLTRINNNMGERIGLIQFTKATGLYDLKAERALLLKEAPIYAEMEAIEERFPGLDSEIEQETLAAILRRDL